MNDKLESLIKQIKHLEKELDREVQRKEVQFFYEIRKKKVHFTREAKARNRDIAKRIHLYLADSRILVIISAPFIWACLLPILLLDLFISVYQRVCFPIYGIPRVDRAEYVVIDRHRLGYLNLIEKLNCVYCGYANGILAYSGEIAARTEQHWCPIKHALRMKSIHNRYQNFIEFGDAEGFRKNIESIRRSYDDLDDEDS